MFRLAATIVNGLLYAPMALVLPWAGAGGCYPFGANRPVYWPRNMNHPRTPIRTIAIAATIQAATANRLVPIWDLVTLRHYLLGLLLPGRTRPWPGHRVVRSDGQQAA